MADCPGSSSSAGSDRHNLKLLAPFGGGGPEEDVIGRHPDVHRRRAGLPLQDRGVATVSAHDQPRAFALPASA